MSPSRQHRSLTLALVLTVVGGLCVSTAVAAEPAKTAKQRVLERMFGDAVQLDPAVVAKVKALKPGTKHWVDRDGDGKNDEVWYIDPAARHMDKTRPVLVRVIDEDGDLDAHMGGDLDSDLYIADWKADGTVDCVLDYQDNDGDNDLDEMGFYYWRPTYHYLGKDVLLVWWGHDNGDDNLLWYDVSYTYNQRLCQYRCHFSGEEELVQFGFQEGFDRWVPLFENPFAFYDPDGDLCSEVVLRVSGQERCVESIRYSFDADDDAYGRRTHDYDFSITALAPGTRWFTEQERGQSTLLVSPDMMKTHKLRGVPTGPWIKRERALPWVNEQAWPRAVLTWDEMNANCEGNVERDPYERWEGVIAHPSENFPQIGGPPCSPLNKRNEVAVKGVDNLRLYYDPTDRKLHFKGATEGWLKVDYDLDGKIDAKTTYIDENKDGIFERRQIDINADGKPEFDWPMFNSAQLVVELKFETLSAFYKPVLAKALAESQTFIDTAFGILAPEATCMDELPQSLRHPAMTYFLEKLADWQPETHLGRYMRKTPAGARLYVDLVRDALLVELKKRFGERPEWKSIEGMYASGNYVEAAYMALNLASSKPKLDARRYRSFTKRVPLTLDNSGQAERNDWPVAIPVGTIKALAPDFNAENCAVVGPNRWLDWREIPHQVDAVDPAVGAELSFIADLPEDGKGTYWLHYSPDGKRDVTFAKKTATAEDWVPPNIGWESNRGAWRAYWGQFDFFGKKTEDLIYPTIGKKSYHSEVSWGIDALHVGETSGLGGLTVVLEGNAYPVMNPAGKGDVKFTKKQLVSGPVRAAIELTATNVVPAQPDLTVRMLCLIYAERQETEVRATVTNAKGDVLLAPGVVKLPREQVFGDAFVAYGGVWGFQESVIDEIGMGLIVPPEAGVDVVDLPDERRVILRPDEGKLRYWLIGDWRRGRQHPVQANADTWQADLSQLALRLNTPVTVAIGGVEALK